MSITTRIVYAALTTIALTVAYSHIAAAEQRLLDDVSTCIDRIGAQYSTCDLGRGGYSRTLTIVRT